MPLFPHSDKVSHFIEYAILGFLLIRAFSFSNTKLKVTNLRLIAVLLAILYGITDEIHQYFVPGRFADILDLLSDSIGAIVGQFLYRIKK